MKSKKKIPLILFGLVFILALTAVIAPFGEKQWQSEVLYDGDPDFVQLEMVNGEPKVAYTDNGITLMEKKGLFGDQWQNTTVTESENSGFYLSMKEINGEIKFAHQYSGLGDRKLGYTRKVNESWETVELDSSSGTGLGAGMYSSLTHLNDEPVIFYHTAENDQFLKIQRINDSWEKELLQTDTGQFVSSDSCGNEAHVIYRSRENSSLQRGTYNENGWSSQTIEGDTDSATDVEAKGCSFTGAFHNTDTGQITYLGDETEEVAPGKFSRLSLEENDDTHLSYYRYGEGLFYGLRNQGQWEIQEIDTERDYAGERNELELLNNGNPAIVYTTDSEVIYTEYSKVDDSGLNMLLILLTLIMAVPALLSLLYVEEELLMIKSKVFKPLKR